MILKCRVNFIKSVMETFQSSSDSIARSMCSQSLFNYIEPFINIAHLHVCLPDKNKAFRRQYTADKSHRQRNTQGLVRVIKSP